MSYVIRRNDRLGKLYLRDPAGTIFWEIWTDSQKEAFRFDTAENARGKMDGLYTMGVDVEVVRLRPRIASRVYDKAVELRIRAALNEGAYVAVGGFLWKTDLVNDLLDYLGVP